jgi:hypothetical protein
MFESATRGGEVGFALAATVLRQRGVVVHKLSTLVGGMPKAACWSSHQAEAVRLVGLIGAILGNAKPKATAQAVEAMLRRANRPKPAGPIDGA